MKKTIFYLLLVIDAITVIGVFYIFLTFDYPLSAAYLAFLGCLLQVICCVVGLLLNLTNPWWQCFYGFHIFASGLFFWFAETGGFRLLASTVTLP